MENLLALCPTCHALYHRGTITADSIRHWKERLVMLNKVVDVQAEIETRVHNAIEQKTIEPPINEQRKGFALAACEFSWRTCQVGFAYEEQRFVDTGFCCFVGPNLAITATEVVDWAIDIGKMRGGAPVILTRRGMAPFVVRERFDDLGGVATIEMGDIDDRYTEEMLKKSNPAIAPFFYAPIQTPVRFRIAPFWGERVGFIHSSDDTEEYRNGMDLQFDSADVAFNLTCSNKDDFLKYALTPVVSRVQHRGSPVFTEDSRLVGVIKDSIMIKGERIWRPVVGGVVALSDRKKQKP